MPSKKILFGTIGFLLDSVAAKMRWMFLPLWLISRIADWIARLFWMMVNEYLKSRIGGCGQGVRLYGRFRVTNPKGLHLGDNVHINANAFIRAEGGVTIGDNTHIARNLVVYSMNHDFEGQRLPYDHHLVRKPVLIGKNVWIGINVTIAPGATIRDGAIIGMGAVVAGTVPKLAVIGAPPWRILKHRNEDRYVSLEAARRYGGMSGLPYKSSPGAPPRSCKRTSSSRPTLPAIASGAKAGSG